MSSDQPGKDRMPLGSNPAALNAPTKRPLEKVHDLEPEPKRMKLSSNNPPSLLSTEDVISKLTHILDEIEQPTNVSIHGQYNSLPLLPELVVDGIGRIPLPISDHQLPILIELCHKSSFGRGVETKTNENVRKSYELTADKFCFQHPLWNQEIKKLVRYVALRLGCNEHSVANVEEHCYKLLIYEKDGHFVQHRDTQKIDGMFATLVVQLPSIYTNAEDKATLVINHKNKKYKYYFGTNQEDANNCRYNVYFSAHYCDLQHSINKIATGTRIAVTYNLCWNGTKDIMPNISNFDNLTVKIEKLLSEWDGDNAIALNTEHLYTDSELRRDGIKALKGSDAAKVQTIRSSLANKSSLRFFVAEVTRRVEEYDTMGSFNQGACEWEECDRDETIDDNWYAEDGTIFKFGKYINLDLCTHCIGYDEDQEWEEVDQTQEGYLGNEGATQTTTYSKYIVIFFKSQHMFDLLLNGRHGIEAGLQWIQYLTKKKQHILPFINIIVATFIPNKANNSQIVPILKLLKQNGAMKLLETFVNKLIAHNIGLTGGRSTFHWSQTKNNIIQTVGDIIVKFGWIQVIKSIILKWCECLLTDDYKDIAVYCSLPTLIKTHIDECTLSAHADDDIIVLSNNKDEVDEKDVSDKRLNDCYHDVTNTLWQMVKRKIDLLKGDGKVFAQLDAKNIECILGLMMIVNVDESEQTLVQIAYKANVKQTVQKQLVKEIKGWKEKSWISSGCIQLILLYRIKYLKKEVENGEPQFTWKMPAGTGIESKHSDFTTFLQSTRQTFTKTGFSGIAHARRWANKYSGSGSRYGYCYGGSGARRQENTLCYSVDCNAEGRGSNAYVTVTKNKNYFNSLQRVYNEKVNELKSLCSLITVDNDT